MFLDLLPHFVVLEDEMRMRSVYDIEAFQGLAWLPCTGDISRPLSRVSECLFQEHPPLLPPLPRSPQTSAGACWVSIPNKWPSAYVTSKRTWLPVSPSIPRSLPGSGSFWLAYPTLYCPKLLHPRGWASLPPGAVFYRIQPSWLPRPFCLPSTLFPFASSQLW